jgi:hypothetical protein
MLERSVTFAPRDLLDIHSIVPEVLLQKCDD